MASREDHLGSSPSARRLAHTLCFAVHDTMSVKWIRSWVVNVKFLSDEASIAFLFFSPPIDGKKKFFFSPSKLFLDVIVVAVPHYATPKQVSSLP
jgi:hypothetical protein